MSIRIDKIFLPVEVRITTADFLHFALLLARAFGAKLLVGHCLPDSVSRSRSRSQGREFDDLIRETRQRFPLLTTGASFDALAVRTQNNQASELAVNIASQTARISADLILLPGSFSDAPCGLELVAESVVHIAPCSVLILPQLSRLELTKHAPSVPRFERVLAAHDFSDYSEFGLQMACRFSETFGARLDLLHILEGPNQRDTGYECIDETAEKSYYRALSRLQIVARSCELGLTKGVVPCVRWGTVYREILDFTEDSESDLVVMGARGSDFGYRSLFGSNVERVVRQVPRPILVARPRKSECSRFPSGSRLATSQPKRHM